ncbi:Myb-like_DNA-binding domain-containing protein [Hexamita inflata]|uniref:Myb-like DNA-binding domain-containing protein n=1 Tax=Hexamita inflata TaxID=28002 RepID=A0AA86ND18_9EUKA|nr:Myb-like DNA-binding domain-containing protein [Hexamita inflata]CAI9945553.1 Myb-like DNA-binding domain-containing protein [Hexamita inflata]
MYLAWSDADISRLIDIVESQTDYERNKVNWIKVQTYFQERTVQQCKSFYCNKIRPFIFQPDGLRKIDVKFVHMCYFYFIQRPVPDPDEQLDQKISRILAEQCWSDMLGSFYNKECVVSKKLLQGVQCMLTYHFQMEQEIVAALKTQGKYSKLGYTVTKDKWNEFIALTEKHNINQMLQFVNTELAKMESAKDL